MSGSTATSTLRTESLTGAHWIGIVAATISAMVHLVLGVGFLPHWMGIAFLAATAGFLGGVWFVVTDRHRRRVYLLGVPFTAGQIGFWYALNDVDLLAPATIDPVHALDKIAQVVLLIVLVGLYRRES